MNAMLDLICLGFTELLGIHVGSKQQDSNHQPSVQQAGILELSARLTVNELCLKSYTFMTYE